ncbi:MAG: universal stress protein [Isosphaeraceae bacterium]
MTPFRNILFGADFSEGSRDAFRAACSLAAPGQTRIHVLHVIEPHWVPEEPVPYGQLVPGFYGASVEGREREALLARMREMYAPCEPVDLEYIVEEGEAARGILDAADRLRPDLIVVGTHGRTGLSWLLAGSVATQVVRHAGCPVLALHRPEHERQRQAEGARVILHPTDFSKGCEISLRVARGLARDLGARLVLLHVVPFGVYASEMSVPIDPEAYREALEEERRLLDGADMKYPVEARMARGDAAEEILRAAADLDADLIVMGTHGRTGLSRLFLGSVAEYVMPRAECPVLAVKTTRETGAHASEPATPIAAAH